MPDEPEINRLLGERLRQQREQTIRAKQQAQQAELQRKSDEERQARERREALIAEVPRMMELLIASNYPITDFSRFNAPIPVPRMGRFGPLLDRLFGCHTRPSDKTWYGWLVAVQTSYHPPSSEWSGELPSYSTTNYYLFSDGSFSFGLVGRFPQDIEDTWVEHYLSSLRKLRSQIEGGQLTPVIM